ncbi:hypothetical protein L596_012446 [Steinernema carpocapsae]|uniref:Uncharacterized protein n=1 Tax=Steinernema carpocapsae TaxID=34508 RepID=A0A4U5NXP8_STECR|nr:hypothetical protein L596_012446 [Steinernema carpocapsae]
MKSTACLAQSVCVRTMGFGVVGSNPTGARSFLGVEFLIDTLRLSSDYIRNRNRWRFVSDFYFAIAKDCSSDIYKLKLLENDNNLEYGGVEYIERKNEEI